MFYRLIKVPIKQSFFLFGARGTGKSTLVKSTFPKAQTLYIDLLRNREEQRLAMDPDDLERQINGLDATIKYIIIDEIQKVPKLLDIVHRLIESTDKVFVLTGSSARKLKKGAANLLAGRAFERRLFPLTTHELGDTFNLMSALQWGTLPKIFQYVEDEDKDDFLFSYGSSYLKEEVWGEQLVRKLDPFRRFLSVAAQSNGKILNYSNIPRDTGVDYKTVQAYYQILEDTLLGYILEPYLRSVRKRINKSPKFYFFDTGVTRSLAGLLAVPPTPSTSYFGEVFEQWVILEFLRQEAYHRKGYQFYYYQTLDGIEVDLVIERPGKPLAVVEIKSTDHIRPDKLKKFKKARPHFENCEMFCLSRDEKKQVWQDISIIPWQNGLSII